MNWTSTGNDASDIEALKQGLAAAETKESEWLKLAVALARARAPRHEIDAAYARHAEAQERSRALVRELNAALLA